MLLWLVLAVCCTQARGAVFRDDRNNTRHVIRVDSCPDVGYFFRRLEGSDWAGACHLCFCHSDGTAVCLQRENRLCDASNYQHNAIRKRETRVRRSPGGLGDIFFRDATRDIFNKNTPQTCKPYESSFSEGCPPDDWCIGCTVCDCDANGRWDCHILSFCPDKENKKVMRTAKKTINNQKSKSKIHHNKARASLLKTTKKPIQLKPQKKESQTKNIKPQIRKSVQNNNKPSPKPLIVRKRIVKRKPVYKLNKNKIKFNATDKEIITQEVVKRVMAVMQRLINKSKIINKELLTVLPSPRPLEKQSTINPKAWKYGLLLSDKKRKKYSPQNKVARPESKATTKRQVKRQVKSSTPKYKNDWTMTRIKRNVQFHNVSEDYGIKEVTSTANKKLNDSKMVSHSFAITKELDSTTKQDVPKMSFVNKDNIDVSKFNKTNLKRNDAVLNNHIYFLNETIHEAVSLTNTSNFNEYSTGNTPIKSIILYGNHFNNKYSPLFVYSLKSDFNTSKNTSYLQTKQNVISDIVKTKVEEQVPKYNHSNIIDTMVKNLSNAHTNYNKNKQKKLNTQNTQNVFERLLRNFRTNSTALENKNRKFNIMKYLRKFIKNIFYRRRKALSNTTNIKKKYKNQIIETICDILKQCNPKQKNNKSLDLKIKELNLQSHIILKSLNIIKGLLRLVRFISVPETKDGKNNVSGDIHKLNFILKGKYNNTLSDSEKVQIDYIKSNTKTFIDAVGKFAYTLSEIIHILTQQSKTKKEDIKYHHNKNHDFFNTHRHIQKNTLSQEVHELKKLLVKYNLVQNSFMKKMYNVLKSFERTQTNKATPEVSLSNNKLNTTVAIERISRAIVKNLRTLKNLAETLNSSSRRKRSIGYTDTVEYLLTLMEYFLKKNTPLDTAPVNDGIDLLTEAIKNAPDVKLIKEIILLSTETNLKEEKTTETPFQVIIGDDISDNSRINKEDSYSLQARILADKERISRVPKGDFMDYEGDVFRGSVKYQNNLMSTENPPNQIEANLPNLQKTQRNKENFNIFTDADKFLNKFQTGEGRQKFEEFEDDSEEEESGDDTTTNVAELDTQNITETYETTFNFVEINQFTTNSSRSNKDRQRHVTLDWLDADYEQYHKDENIKKSKNVTSKPLPKTVTARNVQTSQKQADPISSITIEDIDENDKMRKEKVKADDILHRKEMNMLNSLDYGTEKSESVDSINDKEEASIYY